jgi:hypothetical protein
MVLYVLRNVLEIGLQVVEANLDGLYWVLTAIDMSGMLRMICEPILKVSFGGYFLWSTHPHKSRTLYLPQ